ncbi:hypothetical protein KCU93_g2682, partial [Aureobasidium melanogenum]
MDLPTSVALATHHEECVKSVVSSQQQPSKNFNSSIVDMGVTNSTPKKNNLFNVDTLSDVTVKFSRISIHAHKSILSLNSNYFHKAFSGKWQEATGKEIDLKSSDNPNAIQALLRHCYNLPYDDVSVTTKGSYNLAFHADVFLVGDKYEVDNLCDTVLENFEDFAKSVSIYEVEREDVMEAYKIVFAGKLSDDRLQKAVKKYLNHNIIKFIQDKRLEHFLQPEDTLIAAMFQLTINNTNAKSIRLCQKCGGKIHGRLENHACETPIVYTNFST